MNLKDEYIHVGPGNNEKALIKDLSISGNTITITRAKPNSAGNADETSTVPIPELDSANKATNDGNGNNIANTYLTKSSGLTDIGLYTGTSADKNTSKSLTNGNVYLKANKTINGTESLDSQVKIYGSSNVSVETDTDGNIKVNSSVTESSFTSDGKKYTMFVENGSLKIELRAVVSLSFVANSGGSSTSQSMEYGTTGNATATVTPSNKIKYSVVAGAKEIELTKYTISNGTTIKEVALSDTIAANSSLAEVTTTALASSDNGYAGPVTATYAYTTSSTGSAAASSNTLELTATLYYTEGGVTKTITATNASVGVSAGVSSRWRRFIYLTSKPSSTNAGTYKTSTTLWTGSFNLSSSTAVDIYIAFPLLASGSHTGSKQATDWGVPSFTWNNNPDTNWIDLNESFTLNSTRYEIYKYKNQINSSFTWNLTGWTAITKDNA